MAREGTLLVVDDNRSILSAVKLLAEKYFAEVVTLSSPNRLQSIIGKCPVDVVLLDMNFSAGINTGNEGLYWLNQIHSLKPEIKVVLFTAYADIDLAVRAMKDGAVDFVVKPWDNDKLVASLQNAYNLRRSERRVKQMKEIKHELASEENPMFWGTSAEMRQIREVVEKVAVTDANVLITGENGTGKEMLAREIHRRSLRQSELLVAVDMGAIPETLFESELFGHVKGAFTDARTDRAGKFEMAGGGTLFLDEIGNLPLHLQAKLLTAIQSHSIVRVGSNTPVEIDIRLISATNRNIEAMIAEGTFREDLLYRINTIHIDLPPLRRRRDDIMPLAEQFLARYAKKYGKPIEGFEPNAAAELKNYSWAGNIRELQHTVEKAVIMSEGKLIGIESLWLRPQPARTAPETELSTLEDMERRMISEAIAQHGGNLSAVAARLGITRQTLYNKIKRYGL